MDKEMSTVAQLHPKNALIQAIQARGLTLEIQTIKSVAVILSEFNIAVPSGVIYGLLGPSGCGKTSFLKCVTGLLKKSDGDIRVFGCRPGDYESGVPGRGVGYMPQEIALDTDLSIEETLKYYGRLNFMSYEEINKQINYFIETLSLPSKNSLVSQLSQGQQRRVSYASAIIHNPRLVILDEPTVGVDPVVRVKIWDHLTWLSKTHGTTIIITTHYIEEATKANLVGFMRNGSLLLQDSPQNLKTRFNCKNLDEVFYKICFDKESAGIGQIDGSQDALISYQKQPFTTQSSPLLRLWTTMFIFSVLTKKLMVQIEKNPFQLFLKIILAIMTLIACTSCVGPTPHDITVAVVNDERPGNYSSLYLKTISRYLLIQREYDTIEEAKEAVKKHKALSVVHIQANFSQAIPKVLFYQPVNKVNIDSIVKQSKITLYADLGQQPLFATVERILEQTMLEFTRRLARQLGFNPLAGQFPIASGKPIYGRNIEGDYAGWKDFEATGITVAIVFSISFLVVSFSLLKDRKDKIFERNYAAGVTPSHLVLGHLTARFLFTIPFVVVVLMFNIFICELPTEGSLFLTLLILALLSFSGMALGVTLSAIFDDSEVLVYTSNGVLIFLGVIGGLMWPKEALPYWVKWAADLSPLTLACEAFRSILMRGWGMSNIIVFKGFALLTGWTLLFIIIAVVVLELKK